MQIISEKATTGLINTTNIGTVKVRVTNLNCICLFLEYNLNSSSTNRCKKHHCTTFCQWCFFNAQHTTASKSGKGRKPVKLKAQTASTRVDKLVKSQPGDAWKRIKVRETTKGKLIVDILYKTVWLWDEKEKEARLWHLVVRREVDSPNEIIYSL